MGEGNKTSKLLLCGCILFERGPDKNNTEGLRSALARLRHRTGPTFPNPSNSGNPNNPTVSDSKNFHLKDDKSLSSQSSSPVPPSTPRKTKVGGPQSAMTVSVAHAQVSIATATTSGSNVMTLAMGRPNSPANSSGSSDTDAVVNSASTALRRLYFKTARSTKSSKNSSVPKVVVMGSSTTSTTETTINTSTESSSTLVTNVTTTDTSEACDSLDFVDISGQSEPLLSSFDEPITTVCLNPSNLHESIIDESDKIKTEIEMPLLGEYTEQANGPKIRSPVEYITSKSTTTTATISTTRFPFDIPTSPNKSVGVVVQEKDKNSFSTLKESFKKQKSIQSIYHNGKRDILNGIGVSSGGGSRGGLDDEKENKKKIENNLLSKCNNNMVLKNERKSNGDDNDLVCLEEIIEINKKPKKNSFRSRNRFLNSIKLSSSSSSSSSSASSTVSSSAAAAAAAASNKEKYSGMNTNINSAPATIITMTTNKRQQNSNNTKYKETIKNSSIDSNKSSSGVGGGGGGGGGGVSDTTMFPFDREAIDYERIQRECFAVEEEEYDLNSTYNFSTTDRSSYDTDSPIEFEKPYFDSPSKSYKNFKIENFPYEHNHNDDIYQQYTLLTHNEHIEMHEKKINDIGYGAVSKRNKSEKLTNNTITDLEIAKDSNNKIYNGDDAAALHNDDDHIIDDDDDDAFTPKKLTDSMSKIPNDNHLHQLVSKFEQIASKFHQIPPKSSDAFFFNKINQNHNNNNNNNNTIDKNNTNTNNNNNNNIITNNNNNNANDDGDNNNINKENNNTNITNSLLNQQSTIKSFPLSGAISTRSSSPLPNVRVDHFTELQQKQQQQQQQQHQQQQQQPHNNQQKNNKLENCQQLTHNTGPINVTPNPMDTAVCTQPRATIVVQQASLSLDNTVETFLLKSEGDFISVEQGRELLSKKKHQQREENMRQLLDVTNTMTIEERRDFEMRYGSPHHCRSQSVKTPGSRASGRPNQLSLPQQRSRVASMPNTGVEEEYYRLRHFSITGKGVVNRGDSLKSRRSRSNNSVASSNSSTEHLTPANSARTSATCSLASSRESSTSNPATGPFRVLMLGGASVGKSSLVSQFMTSEYLHAYDTSIDDESGEKSVSVLLTGEESELVFIDHASTEMSPENCLSSYDPQGYCVIYSSADQNSFMVAERVLQALWTSENIAQRAVILVGNKADLARSRVISSEEGKAMATAYDCKFIETSVGINHNVDELLVGLLSQIRLKIGNPAKSRDLFRKRSSRKSKRRACSPISTACLTGNGQTNPNTPINGGPITHNISTNDCNTPPGSVQSSPRKYRGSRTSASLKVKGLLGRVWARDSKSKSCENLHVL